GQVLKWKLKGIAQVYAVIQKKVNHFCHLFLTWIRAETQSLSNSIFAYVYLKFLIDSGTKWRDFHPEIIVRPEIIVKHLSYILDVRLLYILCSRTVLEQRILRIWILYSMSLLDSGVLDIVGDSLVHDTIV
uniref:Uncharacterized protein n=1 Tax=Solanum lycopersicum TaxID=4081 RepID=A0A3Q7F7Z0_SOLLC